MRLLFLATLCFALPACQSNGQQNQDESDFSHRRKVPEAVMDSLPSTIDTLAENQYFLFLGYGDIDETIVLDLVKDSEAWVNRVFEFAGGKNNIQQMKWHLYPSSEIKGLMLRNSAPIHLNYDQLEGFSVADSIFQNNYSKQAVALVLRQILGMPSNPALESGLTLWFDESWQGLGHRNWAARLFAAHAIPSLQELLDAERWQSCSHLIYGAAACSLVDFLIEKLGANVFIEKYSDWQPSDSEIASIEREWKEYLNQLSETQMESPRPQVIKNKLPYLQGFNFAHEGYRVYNGYGSRKANQALEHLEKLGSNAVAIVPYTFLRSATQPKQMPVVQQTGAENDESVISSAACAQRLGLTIVMKPQIWLGGGQWPGDIAMNNEEDWAKFFRCYRHWILHFAMLAEVYDWEALCIGTEMVQTTLSRGEDWKILIQDIRKVYHGQLTYAANWGDEFEKTDIWETLDFIGLNCYYPLSQKDNPSDRELEKAYVQIAAKIERVSKKYGKPVVFTEIGFPNIEAPWKKPHEDWGDFETNEKHQQRCYEIVFKTIEGKSWCNGILWWKYPSDMDYQPRRNTGFTPHGKLAEETVGKWFMRNRE